MLLLISGCSNKDSGSSGITLSGMGPNFNYPLFEMIATNYSQQSDNHILYDDNGTLLGVNSFKIKTTDFVSAISIFEGNSDEDDLLYMPIAVGAVVIAYNLPGIDSLKLNASLISKIYRGEIAHWNHPELVRLNPQLTSCNLRITPLFRADGASTTYLLSDYLSISDRAWKEEMGSGSSIPYKHGLGFVTNETVTLNIKDIPGAIGYVSAGHAELMYLSTAWIENSSGRFLKPTQESMMASIPEILPENIQICISNSSAENAYPITAFAWVIVSQKSFARMSPQRQSALVDFLKYIIDLGTQGRLRLVDFAPLTPPLIERAINIIQKLEANEIKG